VAPPFILYIHYFYALSFMYLHIYYSDRLVDCTSLKRAIEFVYSATLPQASKPFIYMSINLPPEHVDVNIHPTKKEVHFKTPF
jgi:DNA mismatch repair protein MLH1